MVRCLPAAAAVLSQTVCSQQQGLDEESIVMAAAGTEHSLALSAAGQVSSTRCRSSVDSVHLTLTHWLMYIYLTDTLVRLISTLCIARCFRWVMVTKVNLGMGRADTLVELIGLYWLVRLAG